MIVEIVKGAMIPVKERGAVVEPGRYITSGVTTGYRQLNEICLINEKTRERFVIDVIRWRTGINDNLIIPIKED